MAPVHTSLSRRELLAALTAVTILPFIPRPTEAAVAVPKPPQGFTIGQLIVASWPDVLNAVRKGRPWLDQELNVRTQRRQIQLHRLSAVLDYRGTLYPIEELSIPMVWSDQDEVKNPREIDRIRLVSSLLQNVIAAHDDVLLETLGSTHGAVVSEEYRYQLGLEQLIPASEGHVIKVYTAFARIPLEQMA